MCSQNILFWKPISRYFSIIQNLLHAMTIKIIIINSHKPCTKIHTNNPHIQILKFLRKSLGVYTSLFLWPGNILHEPLHGSLTRKECSENKVIALHNFILGYTVICQLVIS